MVAGGMHDVRAKCTMQNAKCTFPLAGSLRHLAGAGITPERVYIYDYIHMYPLIFPSLRLSITENDGSGPHVILHMMTDVGSLPLRPPHL
jgi:hypothetical protein